MCSALLPLGGPEDTPDSQGISKRPWNSQVIRNPASWWPHLFHRDLSGVTPVMENVNLGLLLVPCKRREEERLMLRQRSDAHFFQERLWRLWVSPAQISRENVQVSVFLFLWLKTQN